MARKKPIIKNQLGINDVNERFARSYLGYLKRWRDTCISMFEWINLPENGEGQKAVDPWFLETALFETGRCVFFKHEHLGYLVQNVAETGDLNIYRQPTNFTAYTATGLNVELNQNNGVIIYQNPQRSTNFNELELYASRLAEIDSIIDCNIRVQKFPPIMLTANEKLLTAKNIMQQYQGNEPAIFADIDFDPKSITSLNLQAPYLVDRLQTAKHSILNEVYTLLGIDNANTDKRERLLKSEVESNNGQVQASRRQMLFMRKQACKEINRMFGLNIDVREVNSCASNVSESSSTEQVYYDTEELPLP